MRHEFSGRGPAIACDHGPMDHASPVPPRRSPGMLALASPQRWRWRAQRRPRRAPPAGRAACRPRSRPRCPAAGCRAMAMVAWVEEVGSATQPRARLAGRPARQSGVADEAGDHLAALELLGPACTWSTPVWLQGTIADGVLDGQPGHQGHWRPEARARADVAADAARAAGRRARDPRRHRRSTAAPSFPARSTRPISTASRCARTTPAPTRCCSTTAPCCSPSRPSRRAASPTSPSIRRSPALRVDASVPLTSTARATTGAARSRPISPTRPKCASRGAYQVGLRREGLVDRLRRPEELQRARPRSAMWRELGGKLSGGDRDGARRRRRRASSCARRRLPEVVRDINKLSNNVMAQQLFLTPRRDPARRRHARGGARGAAPVAGRPHRQRPQRRA